MPQSNPTIERLEDQIIWYGNRSGYNQRMFKALKTATVVASVTIPLCAAAGAPPFAAGILGGLIALIEIFQQMNQYHQNWINYRSTAEALNHEKYLFLANSGPYSRTSATGTTALLAERIESLISQEHAKWASAQEQAGKDQASTA
jgi:hypothetical protein